MGEYPMKIWLHHYLFCLALTGLEACTSTPQVSEQDNSLPVAASPGLPAPANGQPFPPNRPQPPRCVLLTAPVLIEVSGTVIDGHSGKALPDVLISAKTFGDAVYTDEAGHFNLKGKLPYKAAPLEINATRHSFLDLQRSIALPPDEPTLNLQMKPVPVHRPQLTGKWAYTLTITESRIDPSITKRKQKPQISGTIHFVPNTPDPNPPEWRGTEAGETVMSEFGSYTVANPGFFGEKNWAGKFTQAAGYITPDNRVSITLPPTVRDAGVILDGTWQDRAITGTWMRMGYVPSYSGTFTMYRLEYDGDAMYRLNMNGTIVVPGK